MSKGRILIVEDEYIVAANVEAALEERGFETVGIAPDMAEALSLAAKKPDLALVDIHLRDGATGPEIAHRLYRDYGVQVLFVTANDSLARDQTVSGVLGVLAKPCDDELLGAAVDYIISDSTGRQVDPPVGLSLFR